MASENINNKKEEKTIPRLYPSKAIKDIKNINDVICNIQYVYSNAINTYFDRLYELWTSPKALEFYGRACNELRKFNSAIINFNDSIINELVASYNRIAPSHRESSISVSKGPYNSLKITRLLEKSPSGKVGMDDKMVENVSKEFLMQIKNIVNKTSPIPSMVSFYDTDGKLAGSCNTKISELRLILERTLSKTNLLVDEVDDAVSSVRKATASAISVLNSRS